MVIECFFRRLHALWGESVVKKYWARSVRGGGWAGTCYDVWEEAVVVSFQDEGVWISCGQVECRNGGVEVDVSVSCVSGW